MALVNGYKIKENGNINFPVTTLIGILDNRKLSTEADVDNSANRIAQGGVIKRAYVPHDVSPLIAVTDAEPSLEGREAGDIYYNTETKLLYRATFNDQDQLYWYTGADRADEPKSDRIFVDISTGKMYFWFNDNLNEVGGGGGSSSDDYGFEVD